MSSRPVMQSPEETAEKLAQSSLEQVFVSILVLKSLGRLDAKHHDLIISALKNPSTVNKPSDHQSLEVNNHAALASENAGATLKPAAVGSKPIRYSTRAIPKRPTPPQLIDFSDDCENNGSSEGETNNKPASVAADPFGGVPYYEVPVLAPSAPPRRIYTAASLLLVQPEQDMSDDGLQQALRYTGVPMGHKAAAQHRSTRTSTRSGSARNSTSRSHSPSLNTKSGTKRIRHQAPSIAHRPKREVWINEDGLEADEDGNLIVCPWKVSGEFTCRRNNCPQVHENVTGGVYEHFMCPFWIGNMKNDAGKVVECLNKAEDCEFVHAWCKHGQWAPRPPRIIRKDS